MQTTESQVVNLHARRDEVYNSSTCVCYSNSIIPFHTLCNYITYFLLASEVRELHSTFYPGSRKV